MSSGVQSGSARFGSARFEHAVFGFYGFFFVVVVVAAVAREANVKRLTSQQ